jgi:hypothetical protein
MARNIFINGESLVLVKGPAGSAIAGITELGLAESQLRISIKPKTKNVNVEAWGEAPVDVQRMNSVAAVSMNLIHYDKAILKECIRLAMGGAAYGQVSRAGALLGGGAPLLDATNSLISLNIASPVGQDPWQFLASYLNEPIGDILLGVEKSVITLSWMCIPYTSDPWQGGIGATNYPLWLNQLAT